MLIVCISASVPASRCRALGAAEAPESKLLLGGDETREHPERMQGGNLQLWRSQGGVWEWWENGEFGVDGCLLFMHELEHNFLAVIPLHGISSRQEVSIIDRKGSVGTHFLRMVNYASFRLSCVLVGVYTVYTKYQNSDKVSMFLCNVCTRWVQGRVGWFGGKI